MPAIFFFALCCACAALLRPADCQSIPGELQHNKGQNYYHGLNGIEQNDAKASTYFFKAAAKGHANAQNYLGVMYENGRGVEKDDGEAFKWYEKAAAQAHATAQNNLGFMYQHGRGAEQNDDKAVALYRKAANQGYAIAQNNMAFMCLHGRGVPKDDVAALEWYRKAADQGYVTGQDTLWHGKGIASGFGKGMPTDGQEITQSVPYTIGAEDLASLAAAEQAQMLESAEQMQGTQASSQQQVPGLVGCQGWVTILMDLANNVLKDPLPYLSLAFDTLVALLVTAIVIGTMSICVMF